MTRSAVVLLAVLSVSMAHLHVHAEDIEFSRDIRPLLVGKCYSCHGPDDENREGELRLDFAANCLLARRLAERGVRFIQLYHRAWDHHGGVKKNMAGTAAEVDRSTTALIKDLKQRGMLDETLILWGGEFGRTPMAQGNGRDHHIKGFSMMLCGGGVQGGVTYGATDDFGYNAIEDPVSVHDLHATMLHAFGIDHSRFNVKFQGLDFGLSGVGTPRVVKEILT